MAYSNFTLRELERRFNITQTKSRLFQKPIPPKPPSERLKLDLDEASQFPLFTEKAKSELLITPLLKEWIRNNGNSFTFFSGVALGVSEELSGICDYILSSAPQSIELRSPIFCLVEAKNRAVEEGFGQCAAEMYAAKLFNEQDGAAITKIYGAVTTGYDWAFLKLENSIVQIDIDRYQLANLAELLGVLQLIANTYS